MHSITLDCSLRGIRADMLNSASGLPAGSISTNLVYYNAVAFCMPLLLFVVKRSPANHLCILMHYKIPAQGLQI